jgi:hypothetical protein
MNVKSDWIRLLVKYKGKCAQCGKEIPVGEYALWSKGSKAIKHVKCETNEVPKVKGREVMDLECFICGRPAECTECNFDSDCNKAVVSQACICNRCLESKNAYLNYQQAFLEKMRKLLHV